MSRVLLRPPLHTDRDAFLDAMMAEAMDLVLERAFGPIGLHRVEVNIQPGNLASIALARRVGFEKEGFSPEYLMVDGAWRDHERWAIRESVWRAAAAARR